MKRVQSIDIRATKRHYTDEREREIGEREREGGREGELAASSSLNHKQSTMHAYKDRSTRKTQKQP